MDISKEYIKMCDCPEIQGLWKYEKGDWFADKYFDKCGAGVIESTLVDEYIGDNWNTIASRITEFNLCQSIWLPRQDQLQEMYITTHDYKGMATIKDEASFPQSLIHSIWFFAFETDGGGDYAGVNEYAHQFTSMEQLWLAIVMQMKHNKTWNGEAWAV